MKFAYSLAILGLLAAVPASAADYFEFEPNNDFPPSFLPGNPVFLSGDRLLGQRNPGESDKHYLRFGGTGAPGLYRYEVNMAEGGDGFLALFDTSHVGFNLSINDDFPGNDNGRPRLFFDHFDKTGGETVWGVEVDGFSGNFDYAVEFHRTPIPIASIGLIGAAGGVGAGEVEAGRGSWFSFSTAQEGQLVLETSGDFDTEIALFNGHGETINANDDSDSSLLSRIQTVLPAGTYYIAVGGFKANYDWDSFFESPVGWDRDGFGSFTDGFFSDFQQGPVGLHIGFTATTPEPGAGTLLAAGVAVAAGWRCRKRAQK